MTDQETPEGETTDEPAATRPVLRVVTPDATPEEVAALVAVFSALGSAAPPARPRPSQWSSPVGKMRPPAPHPSVGWKGSALPR